MVERGSYVGFALPGLTVAIAFIFFGINVARPIYQTLVLLLAAYVVLFLPTTLGAARAGLLQVDPRTEEAARTLGKNTRQVLWRVTIPAVRGSMAAGAAMAFLLVMKELPAALLLGPVGFRTLATVTWSAAQRSLLCPGGRVGPPAHPGRVASPGPHLGPARRCWHPARIRLDRPRMMRVPVHSQDAPCTTRTCIS